jgi:dUTP pyrophosphatase
MKVKVINRSSHALPAYETRSSAGMDVRADIGEAIVLKSMDRALIPTGLFLEIPHGYECQVRPRSGLAMKRGVSVLNTPGTIDADYRGEVGVILFNMSDEEFTVENGERIAQLVFAPVLQVEWDESESLSETERGAGGFGSTGTR